MGVRVASLSYASACTQDQWSLLLQYDLSKRLSWRLRYSLTRLQNETSIGSSVNALLGDEREDIKL